MMTIEDLGKGMDSLKERLAGALEVVTPPPVHGESSPEAAGSRGTQDLAP